MADRLKLDEQKARTIQFTRAELETVRQKAQAAVPDAEKGRKRNSLSNVACVPTRANGIRSVSKANEPVLQRMWAAFGAMPSSSKLWPTMTMSDMMSMWNEPGRSIPNSSTPRRPPTR
jgi:hypothetical protein